MFGGEHVSMRDYAGFGSLAMGDLGNLQKALESGYAISGQTGGAALRVQSLEASLKVLTYRSEHVKLWKKIDKSAAFSTAEEYNQVTSYGNTRAGVFTMEGELPQSSDSTYTRRMALVKFLGTTREVTHPMTLVNPAHGDVIALTAHNAILHLMRQVEYYLFHGDSSLAFSGEAEEWDGMDAMIDATAFIDLEGQPLQESDITDAANYVVETGYGYPTDIFLGVKAQADFVKTMYPRTRVNLPAPVDGQVGLNVQSMATPGGVINFNPNIFLRRNESPQAAATSANAPATPASATSPGILAANTADWDKLVGTVTATQAFTYAVSACNRFGESAPVFYNYTMAVATANTNAAVRLNVVNAAAIGANPPEYLKIYRTRPGTTSTTPADFGEILRVPVSSQTAGATMTDVATDRNLIIPHTSIAYLGQMAPDVLTFRQLAPMMKMDLSVIAPAYRFMVLLYGVPILFAPQKWVRIINIKDMAVPILT